MTQILSYKCKVNKKSPHQEINLVQLAFLADFVQFKGVNLNADSAMKILIDNRHGIDTKGKRSPDGRLLEYAQNRLLVGRIVSALQARGLSASLLVPEETDIPLLERCCRVNEWCLQLCKDNVLLISIHCNPPSGATAGSPPAAGAPTPLPVSPVPMPSPPPSTTPPRPTSPACASDQEADFYLLRHTSCPAVLTENLFMDNPSGCTFLLSPEGPQSLVDLHVDGIISHLDSL